MKRILINATHNEEIRVALCKDKHLCDFDLENRTREQKKANIYKGHVTRVEPSLEAVFVEYGSVRQGFLPLREIAPEYLKGNPKEDNIKQLIKEGDEVIVQVEKEERGNKGAALSTYISLAGRYLVLMPNNPKAGGISRQISGKVREEMKQIIANLEIPRSMSVIVRTAGLGKGFEDLQNDLNHLLEIWSSIIEQNKARQSPCLIHQEAGVVTRAMRDYLRDDIGEVWIDSEHAYNEAANFIAAVMPSQLNKLRKYTDYEPMFARFDVERQIETAYQREVRLPSGGSIVIDQTEALVSIDINSSKSTKGSDVAETAYHTNLEAAEEIARQLRLRDMGGLIVIDFIDMNDNAHQKEVEKRLIEATRYDRARVQFAEISKFGLMEMSRQRLRPSLEESTGYICPRCHGNGMIRDLRSLSLSIMRQIEQIALKQRSGEIQAEVPTDIAAFLLNEKRESLVYLEQDSGTRITILPHAHLESPNFSLHFNPDGFAPSSYERIADSEEKETVDRGYDVNWQTKNEEAIAINRWQQANVGKPEKTGKVDKEPRETQKVATQPQSQAVAWLSNLFAPKKQARLAGSITNQDAAMAIENIVNNGRASLGSFGSIDIPPATKENKEPTSVHHEKPSRSARQERSEDERKPKSKKPTPKRESKESATDNTRQDKKQKADDKNNYPKRESNSHREPRGEMVRGETLKPVQQQTKADKVEHVDKKEPQEKPQKEQKATEVAKASQETHHAKEVVLHVKPINKPTTPLKTVRVSLDDGTQKVPPQSEATKTDEVIESAVQEPTAQVQALNHQDDKVDDSAVEMPKTVAQIQTEQLPDESKKSQEVASVTRPSSELISFAKSMNKAPNDPRVVMAYHAQSARTIQGTAGEFIKSVLGDAIGSNFVVDFINAVQQHQSKAVFDFANYGYLPLTQDYLADFKQGILPQSQWSTRSGKTQVGDCPVKPRATNDPRGQIVDEPKAEESTQSATTQEAVQALVDNDPQETSNQDKNPQASNQDDLQPQGQDAQTTFEDKSPEGGQTLLEVASSAIQAATRILGELTQSQEEQVSDDEQVETSENKSDNEPKKDKSYKDMIENVSGQLSMPNTSILTLVTPKKIRATKPKTKPVARKTSKAAQKAQVVKRKSKSQTDGVANEDKPQS